MLLLAAIGCSFTPSATAHDVTIRDPTLEGATIDVVVAVHNPLPAAAQVEARWDLRLDGAVVAEGAVDGLDVAAGTDTLLTLPVPLRWMDLWAVAGTVGREVPWSVELELTGHTGLGSWTVPYAHTGRLPALSWPEVEMLDWRVDRFDSERVEAVLVVDVQQAVVHQLTWAAHVGVVPMAHGRVEHAEGATELPVAIEVGRAWEALQTIPVAGVGLSLDGGLQTPLGTIPVTLERRWTPDDSGAE